MTETFLFTLHAFFFSACFHLKTIFRSCNRESLRTFSDWSWLIVPLLFLASMIFEISVELNFNCVYFEDGKSKNRFCSNKTVRLIIIFFNFDTNKKLNARRISTDYSWLLSVTNSALLHQMTETVDPYALSLWNTYLMIAYTTRSYFFILFS